jgi:hypothetical protein
MLDLLDTSHDRLPGKAPGESFACLDMRAGGLAKVCDDYSLDRVDYKLDTRLDGGAEAALMGRFARRGQARGKAFAGVGRGSAEQALALQIDHLLGLHYREGDGILATGVGIGADEAMFLAAVGCVLLDAASGLVLAAGEVGAGRMRKPL